MLEMGFGDGLLAFVKCRGYRGLYISSTTFGDLYFFFSQRKPIFTRGRTELESYGVDVGV
jgi:hypothetical protein